MSLEAIDFKAHLPPYRSLLTPNARYDYRTHSLVPINEIDLKRITLMNAKRAAASSGSRIKMKYRSLLDASKCTSILSLRLSNHNRPASVTIRSLPIEILTYIMELVDDKDTYYNCLFVCKLFQQITVPVLYKDLQFTSTYRFAQFVTYLRLCPEVGTYVRSVDLSHIRSGHPNDDGEFFDIPAITNEENLKDDDSETKILAGWRDWKFKKNPLYTMHSPVLTRMNTTSQSLARSSHSSKSYKLQANKILNISKSLILFRGKKRQKIEINPTQKSHASNRANEIKKEGTHPLINRFLINYSNSKDIPIGYILHLISLCPNIVSMDLANISLSTDYEIKRPSILKFKTFDLTNNYTSDLSYPSRTLMASRASNINRDLDTIHPLPLMGQEPSKSKQLSVRSNSSASSMYSITFSHKRHDAQFPPFPSSVIDMSYLKRGDGRFFLSDLNLKSMNPEYLTRITEGEILQAITRQRKSTGNLKFLNLSSMIWLTRKSVLSFLKELVDDDDIGDLEKESANSRDVERQPRHLSSPEASGCLQANSPKKLVVDLTDSGMYKNLNWAQMIDFNSQEGRILAKKIIEDRLFSTEEEILRNERIRRGRMGENYLS